MNPNPNSLWVELGARRYQIVVGRGVLDDFISKREQELSSGIRGAVVIDQGVIDACPEFCDRVTGPLPSLVLPAGEETKSVDHLSVVWNFLADSKIDRSGFVLALGGGVIGDLTGYAAATYLRGISFYQMPSTLLAMVDSSVGGKTGINLPAGKNLVGSFHQPSGVWSDLELLDSLPAKEFSSGMAEVIKYGLLGDRSLFDDLLAMSPPLDCASSRLGEIIYRCCGNKAATVEGDERETAGSDGGRALLNLGHTFGHAIEKVAGYGEYLHGEAVAVGLVCAWRLSRSLGHLQEFEEQRLLDALETYELPTRLKEPLAMDRLMDAMRSDKKVDRGNLRFVLLEEIGQAYQGEVSDLDLVEQAWESVGARKIGN